MPLLIAGPGIPRGETREGIVGAVDLYATICELAGSPERPRDSVSFAPQIFSSEATPARDMLYAERFAFNFDGVCSDFYRSKPTRHMRVVRDERFKLIRTRWNQVGCRVNQLELYDLVLDPFEENNLLSDPRTLRDPGVLAPATYEDYCALRCRMMQLGVDIPRIDDVCGLCDACLDPDRDGDFDLDDLSVLLSEFGQQDGNFTSDIDRDGFVDINDLALLLIRFGSTCDDWQ